MIGADCSNNEMWTKALRDGKEALDGVSCISMYGEGDGVFPVASCLEAAKVLGVAEERCHLLEGVGHLGMLEAHEQVAQILQNFISELL